MPGNNRYFKHLSSIIIFSMCWYTIESKPGLLPIDGMYSIIYTSPLTIGSNSSDLLKVDMNKPPDCITTAGTGISWVLIDLGFIVPGIVQLRLYADTFNDDTHKHLSSLEIKMARSLPIKPISDFAKIENTHFRLCGNTGIVSKDTFNAVVDCKSESNARWVLLKKNKTLNLCHISILQNAVQPQCFLSLLRNHSLYSNATSNLEVFKSMRHLTSLECFQNCYTESKCQGVAFVPISIFTGICQLLKVKSSMSNLFCDVKCQLSINVCHLGQKIKVGKSDRDSIISIPQLKNDLNALSVEIKGEISCNDKNCGQTGIFIVGSNKKIVSCGRIDPLIYRIINGIFLCEQPIPDPLELIFRTDSNNSEYRYRFKSISLRIAEESTFILDILQYYKMSNVKNISSTTTEQSSKIKITLTTNENNTSSFSSSTKTISSDNKLREHTNNVKSTRSFPDINLLSSRSAYVNINNVLSTVSAVTTKFSEIPTSTNSSVSSYEKFKGKLTSLKSIKSSSAKPSDKSTGIQIFTEDIQILESTSSSISPLKFYKEIVNTKKSIKTISSAESSSLEPSSYTHNNTRSAEIRILTKQMQIPDSTILFTKKKKKSSTMESVTTVSPLQRSSSKPLHIKKSYISSIESIVLDSAIHATKLSSTKTQIDLNNKNKMIPQTQERNINQYTIQPTSKKESATIRQHIYKPMEATTNLVFVSHATAPYIWIILVLFVTILIFVIFVVILVTFLESRRKRKEWDIPTNGLFPMDHHGSEQITLQSSLLDSKQRKLS